VKILLAIDGSRFTEAATQSVISLIRTQDSEVLVLQIVEPVVFSTPPQMASGYAPEMVATLQGQIKEAKDTVARAAEVGGWRTRGVPHAQALMSAVRWPRYSSSQGLYSILYRRENPR